jgi:hypothetical protein
MSCVLQQKKLSSLSAGHIPNRTVGAMQRFAGRLKELLNELSKYAMS